MTGRDLILYILENNLEDEPIFKNGAFIGFITVTEAAIKFDVGVETIKLWFILDRLDGIQVDNEIHILSNAELRTKE